MVVTPGRELHPADGALGLGAGGKETRGRMPPGPAVGRLVSQHASVRANLAPVSRTTTSLPCRVAGFSSSLYGIRGAEGRALGFGLTPPSLSPSLRPRERERESLRFAALAGQCPGFS